MFIGVITMVRAMISERHERLAREPVVQDRADAAVMILWADC